MNPGTLDPSRYEVAIPSYSRVVTLASKTLPLLASRGVDPLRVTVFCADPHEANRYASALPLGMYREIVVAQPGMGAVRNFINRWYPDKSLVFQIDDDVDDVEVLGPDRKLRSVPSLHSVIVEGFTRMLEEDATLWGIYPVRNAFFMKGTRVTTDLRYIVGALWGVLNEHASHCQVTLDDGEDFERTILHYLHAGKVVRLNDHTLKTRYYKEPGGMQVTRTDERIMVSKHMLCQRFPSLATINNSKASGIPEIRLRDQRVKSGLTR